MRDPLFKKPPMSPVNNHGQLTLEFGEQPRLLAVICRLGSEGFGVSFGAFAAMFVNGVGLGYGSGYGSLLSHMYLSVFKLV